MGFLDAIDKLLEPITKKIFASKVGKSIKPLSGDELFANEPDIAGNILYADTPGNIYHREWVENHKSSFDDD
ncbi:MAG: hypothetical protein JZU65_24585 [Chlorobium sp.]|nr:hypothetical protein [Chlorobium sp.]